MPGNVGPLEILIVLIIALIAFGPKRLPELGRSLGKGLREFRGSLSGDTGDDDEATAQRAVDPERTEHAAGEGEDTPDRR